MRKYCPAHTELYLIRYGELSRKKVQKEGVYVYGSLIHCALQKKTAHTIKQLYSNKN